MSFRARQRCFSSPFTNIMCDVVSVDATTGVMSTRSVPARDVPPLPDFEKFALDKLLDAKVDLKQVPCRVLHEKSFDVDKFVKGKKTLPKKTTDQTKE